MSEAEPDPITEQQVADAQADGEPEPVPPNLPPEGEPEPEPTPEPEPEPTPAAPPSDVDMEARYRKVEQAARSYANRVSAIFEEQALDLLPCPLCSIGGTPAFLNKHDAGRIPPPVADAVKVFLGFATEQDYEADPEVHECDTCKGKGVTFTGSKVPGNETRPCARCQGYGYVPPPTAGTNGSAGADVIHFPAGERPETVSEGDVDLSGEPRILPDGRTNPNYGKWPQYKIPVAPWGVTANLTAQDATG